MNIHIPGEVLAALVALAVTIIGGFGLVVNAFFKKLALSIAEVRKDSKTAAVESAATREQVKNDHGTNLRDDVDKVLLGLERLEGAVQVLYDAIETSRADRRNLHLVVDDVKTNVSELKDMYSSAMREHGRLWAAIESSSSFDS